MRPDRIVAWIPVVREIVGLVEAIADRVRARRKRRRDMARSGKR